MNYLIHIYNPIHNAPVIPAVCATGGMFKGIMIAQLLAKSCDDNFCVVRDGKIVAFVKSPSTLQAMEDADGDRYDGVPADTTMTEEQRQRAFFRKCEDANDEAAGRPGNWPKR